MGLGHLSGGRFKGSNALGVSADGSTVVGFDSGGLMFRWTQATGMTALHPSRWGQATGVSANGTVVVGYTSHDAEVFRWTAEGGMVVLGSIGFVDDPAPSIAADGLTIVGAEKSGPNDYDAEAFRWTAAQGLVRLGVLPNITGHPLEGRYSYATDVCGDGSIVVGTTVAHVEGQRGLHPDARAFIWDEANGMRSLQSVLVDLGVDVAGWELESAVAISADGYTIIGSGTDPSGTYANWIATIPEPAALLLPAAAVFLCACRRGARDALFIGRRDPALNPLRRLEGAGDGAIMEGAHSRCSDAVD